MSTEDVIELGSSDDEKEPAPKKIKIKNVRVHIPNQRTIPPGITIKPVGQIVAKNKVHQELKTKGKVVIGSKIYSGNKINVGNVPPNIIINPKVSAKILNKSIDMNKIQPTRANHVPITSGYTKINTNFINKPIGHGTKVFKNLPAGITIKRASNALRRNPLHVFNKKAIVKNIVQVATLAPTPTVELDDEESSTVSMPQWYKRPEEVKNEEQNLNETKAQSMEAQNIKEPVSRSYVEITIEDSPIKPAPSQSNLSAIIIEDSPVKAGLDKMVKNNNSKQQDKQSKKKLDYAYEDKVVDKEMIEIEVDLTETNKIQSESESNKDVLDNSSAMEVVYNTKENDDKEIKTQGNKETSSELPAVEHEFHPVYQKFIETCFQIENSDDMKKIVEKKIKAYYRQCSKEYVASEEFIDFVSGKIIAIEASPDKMYLYIKDVVDELNMQRKLAKAAVAKQEESQEATEVYEVEQGEYDSKRQRHIRKLEKTLKKLHRAIQKLEEQEVDFEDEDDSVYLLTERYKERLVKVHAKFCQLTNTKMPSEPSIKLETPPGRHSGPTKKLEKFINKKVPIGAPLPFPDFHDVLRCVREANEEEKLHLSEMEMIEEARELFIKCGKKLQRRRQENEWRIAASRLSINEDPADKDQSLKRVLENNTQLATKKESEVFNKFVDRQMQLKLEAEEIGDKEAEESPVESEEDEETDQSNQVENKEKRKERLKRLLQKKSKLDVEKSEDKVGVSKSDTQIEQNTVDNNADNKANNENELVTVSDDDKSKDFDELHLLQKLYSESEVDSSESPISLSDTDNDEECTKGLPESAFDVISIENSSYSESENNAEDTYLSQNYDKGEVNYVVDLQGCSSSVKQSLKETKSAAGVEVHEKEVETNFVNYCEINTSPNENFTVSEVISKEKQPLPKENSDDSTMNLKAAKSVEAVGSQENTNLEINTNKDISIPADSKISEENVDETDENRLLESSDDDEVKLKEATEEDNISASKISISSIESTEFVNNNVKAGPANDTEKITSMNVDTETSIKNICAK